MNPCIVTSEYYAKWLGVSPELLNKTGVYWIYNSERNSRPKGYPYTLDIYSFITPETIIISYGDSVSDMIPLIREKIIIGMSNHEITDILEVAFCCETNHNIKYIFDDKADIKRETKAKKLGENDYLLYLDFFKKANPNCKDMSWVKEYFLKLPRKDM